MKTILFNLLIVCLFLSSCQKEKENLVAETRKGQKVVFNISRFTQSHENIGNNSSLTRLMAVTEADSIPLSQKITEMHYIVYDSTGKEVRKIRGPYDFRTEGGFSLDEPIVDFLFPGKYTFVFIAAKGLPGPNPIPALGINSSYYPQGGSSRELPLEQAFLTFVGGLEGPDNYHEVQDIYFEKFELTVGEAGLERDVVLDRIVSKLEVVVEDALPANTNYISLRLPRVSSVFRFAREKPFGGMVPNEDGEYKIYGGRLVTEADKGTTNFRITVFPLNDKDLPLDVIIRAVESDGKIIATKTVNNVSVSTNRRTILTGKLFGPSSQGFHVIVNDKWDTDTVAIPF